MSPRRDELIGTAQAARNKESNEGSADRVFAAQMLAASLPAGGVQELVKNLLIKAIEGVESAPAPEERPQPSAAAEESPGAQAKRRIQEMTRRRLIEFLGKDFEEELEEDELAEELKDRLDTKPPQRKGGTTTSVFALHDDDLALGHCGDSPAFLAVFDGSGKFSRVIQLYSPHTNIYRDNRVYFPAEAPTLEVINERPELFISTYKISGILQPGETGVLILGSDGIVARTDKLKIPSKTIDEDENLWEHFFDTDRLIEKFSRRKSLPKFLKNDRANIKLEKQIRNINKTWPNNPSPLLDDETLEIRIQAAQSNNQVERHDKLCNLFADLLRLRVDADITAFNEFQIRTIADSAPVLERKLEEGSTPQAIAQALLRSELELSRKVITDKELKTRLSNIVSAASYFIETEESNDPRDIEEHKRAKTRLDTALGEEGSRTLLEGIKIKLASLPEETTRYLANVTLAEYLAANPETTRKLVDEAEALAAPPFDDTTFAVTIIGANATTPRGVVLVAGANDGFQEGGAIYAEAAKENQVKYLGELMSPAPESAPGSAPDDPSPAP